MAMRRVLALGTVVALACLASPAMAGDNGQPGDSCYACAHEAIYEAVNRIALLEAKPDVDDAVKGPQITAARAEILRLRAALGPAPRPWSTPCCYSRKPLYIR
jgi:hypothetical protein